MPASTFPTRSEPTSAALVKIPPPTLANKAIELAPKPKPAITLVFWNIIHRTVTPISPIPTTVSPITLPEENATLKAGFRPCMADAAVLTFALTAMFIPINPATAEQIAPATYEIAVPGVLDPSA